MDSYSELLLEKATLIKEWSSLSDKARLNNQGTSLLDEIMKINNKILLLELETSLYT